MFLRTVKSMIFDMRMVLLTRSNALGKSVRTTVPTLRSFQLQDEDNAPSLSNSDL